jgi:hypothetical protein
MALRAKGDAVPREQLEDRRHKPTLVPELHDVPFSGIERLVVSDILRVKEALPAVVVKAQSPDIDLPFFLRPY